MKTSIADRVRPNAIVDIDATVCAICYRPFGDGADFRWATNSIERNGRKRIELMIAHDECLFNARCEALQELFDSGQIALVAEMLHTIRQEAGNHG